jgi:hypothetical protein
MSYDTATLILAKGQTTLCNVTRLNMERWNKKSKTHCSAQIMVVNGGAGKTPDCRVMEVQSYCKMTVGRWVGSGEHEQVLSIH